MKSMTSYGYAQFTCPEYIMSVELKSYNNRYLEIEYNAPSVLSMYETVVAGIIRNVSSRGHVEINIKLKNIFSQQNVGFDEKAASLYAQSYRKLADVAGCCGLDVSVSLSDLLSAPGVISDISEDNPEIYRNAVISCLDTAVAQFKEGKIREGNATKADLVTKIDRIERSLEIVRSNASALESIIKENLTARINEMLGNIEYDSNRILTEVAVMLMRYTINEEVVRLGAHISEFRKLLDSQEPVGKRIDFLCQEMNREINTIGSKSLIVEVNLEVVNMKDCLENIREQVRNVE